MKAKISAARAICLSTGVAADLARHAATQEERRRWKGREDLFTPIAKAWSTDVGCEVASMGVQVHGGMGFIEETGAAQYYRDARIAPIYEGTNGIQAMDLVGRKLSMDGGRIGQGPDRRHEDDPRRSRRPSIPASPSNGSPRPSRRSRTRPFGCWTRRPMRMRPPTFWPPPTPI